MPECPPDIECPVEPKPPRNVEEPEPVDGLPVPLRPDDVSAVEIDALLTVTRDLGRMVGVPTPFIDSVLGLARLKATSLGLLDTAA